MDRFIELAEEVGALPAEDVAAQERPFGGDDRAHQRRELPHQAEEEVLKAERAFDGEGDVLLLGEESGDAEEFDFDRTAAVRPNARY
jgi:hypothetical protein